MRRKLWLLVVPFFLAVCSGLFVHFYAAARANAVRALNEEQALAARQAARGIEEHFAGWTAVLGSLARIGPVITLDDDGRKYLAFFRESHRDQVRAITRVSAAGRILHTVPPNPQAEGSDISYQAHVKEILREHRPVVSDVFRAVQGYDAVAIHVPVFRDGAFDGTLAVVMNFQTLAQRYLAVITAGRPGRAWVVSRDGTVLYSSEAGQAGKAVSENYRDAPSVLAVTERMLRGEQGATTYSTASPAGEGRAAGKRHAVYMPIRLGSTFWSIAVDSSEAGVLSSLVSFRNRLALIMGLLLAGGTGLTFLGAKAWFIVREEEKRRGVEGALRASEARFRAIIEGANEGILVADSGTRAVRFANPEICRMLGYDRDELLGVRVEQLHPGDAVQKAVEAFGRITRGEAADAQLPCLRKDGSVFHANIRGTPMSLDGRDCIAGFYTDVTDRWLLEEERLRSAKLESIGILAGGIAHDFNNLLQGIFGAISVAKRDLDRKSPPFAMLEQAEGALRQSVALATQLLTFSRGGKPLKRPLALRPLVEGAARLSLSGSRVAARLEFDERLTAVEADEGQIAQVVQNIVLNAVQAMPAGGAVTIAARNVRAPGPGVPPLLEPGEYAAVSVRDSGAGIPAEHLSRIFDPWFTTKQSGSGLGLATSYSIVRNHGGALVARSQPGGGSEFTFYLPGTAAVPESAAAPPAAPPGVPAARILLMDDERMVRDVTAQMLRLLGHEVTAVTRGEEAVAAYRSAREERRPYDLALLDLTIRGGLGGEETLRALRAIDPAAKAIVSSGFVDGTAIADFKALGFQACLRKPYQMEALGSVVASVLS